MKTLAKHISRITGALLLLAVVVSCEKEDYLVFTAKEPTEEVSFTNSTSDTYFLTAETKSNIAERFVWNRPDFDAPTTVNYRVEGSVNQDFSTIDYDSGTLSETNHAVTVNDLLGLATMMGLDTDPSTTGPEGEPNNTGTVYFRVHAFVGSSEATNEVSSTSEPLPLSVTLVEETADGGGAGIEIASWGVVGSAANDWGATPDLPFYTTNQDGVLVAYVSLKDGEFKFRENNDWTNNLGDTGADGTLEANGDNIVTTAGDYKITLNLNENTYTIEEYSWGIVGSAWNDWGGAGPDAQLYYDYTTDTFRRAVKLMDGEMKIRFNNDWGLNLGDTGADGTLEENGDNIAVTAGYYLLVVNFNDNSYTLEETDLYGVVGSGYNDWGGAGPDFLLTPMGDDTWVGKGVQLLDGEIKFRVNEDWTVNYGDTGADGVLELNGDNIVVTAGTFDIFLDFSESDPTYTLVPR